MGTGRMIGESLFKEGVLVDTRGKARPNEQRTEWAPVVPGLAPVAVGCERESEHGKRKKTQFSDLCHAPAEKKRRNTCVPASSYYCGR